jgi:hypothetical protein
LIKIKSTAPTSNKLQIENRDMTTYLYFDKHGEMFAGGFKTPHSEQYFITTNRAGFCLKWPELKEAIEVSYADLDFKLVALLRTVTFR